MKKHLLFFSIILICFSSFAKKVKFSVNMTGQTLISTGVHVMGDFQLALGCVVDFEPSCTPLAQETGDTNIYSTVVDIPAFAMYEYIYVNGDQSYEVEIVPDESEIGYNFNTNRWIYVDSLADDTTDIGAVLFGQNAPAGLTLVRFKVDMHEEASVSPNGVHVAGNFNSWDASEIKMYSFGSGVFEIIRYLPAATYEFKYYNGNTIGNAETIPGPCSVNSNREVVLNIDTVMHDAITTYAVCFGNCVACLTASLEENTSASEINIYPNPATNHLTVNSNLFAVRKIEIYDVIGKNVFSELQTANQKLQTINVSHLNSGIYILRLSDSENRSLASQKLVIE